MIPYNILVWKWEDPYNFWNNSLSSILEFDIKLETLFRQAARLFSHYLQNPLKGKNKNTSLVYIYIYIYIYIFLQMNLQFVVNFNCSI